jgi:hypothetical protein
MQAGCRVCITCSDSRVSAGIIALLTQTLSCGICLCNTLGVLLLQGGGEGAPITCRDSCVSAGIMTRLTQAMNGASTPAASPSLITPPPNTCSDSCVSAGIMTLFTQVMNGPSTPAASQPGQVYFSSSAERAKLDIDQPASCGVHTLLDWLLC